MAKDVRVAIVGDARDFSRAVATASSDAARLDGTFTKVSTGFSKVATAAKLAGVAIAGGLAVAGFAGLKTAADFEQTRIAFEGILGSGDKAGKMLKDLRDFAAKTPFEFTGLADSAKQLLAVGFSADEIIPTMETLGNVAATLGVGEAEIQGVVRALGQMRGKGKASAEELSQISEQIPGFSAIKAIAEDMGITTAKAFKLLEKGAIPADAAIESILNGMQEFPGAAGAMDRQSRTLNGVISTFKDTLSGIAIDFITPALPAISSDIQSFSDGMGEFLNALRTGFTEDEGTRIEGIALGIRDAFQTTVNFIRDEVIPRFSDLVTAGFAAVKGWWDENGETVKTVVGDVFGSIAGFATTVYDVIHENLLPAFIIFAAWMANEGPGLEILIAGIAAALGVYAVNAAIAAGATLLLIAPYVLAAVAVGTLAWATDQLVQKFDLMEKGSTVFNWIMNNVLEPFIDLVQDAINLVKRLIDLIPDIPTLPVVGGEGFVPDSVPFLGRFDNGGVMPGVRGRHYPALVAGGETILPTHKAPLSDFTGSSGVNINVYGRIDDDTLANLAHQQRKIRMEAAA